MNFLAFSLKKAAAAGMICFLAVAGAAAPGAARKRTGERLLFRYRSFEPNEIENLQRWVSAGHEVWCKDARLVAAEALKRIAQDFVGDATELNAADPPPAPSDAKLATFEWSPPDGRAVYRVTERFAWLLPIAQDADELVWVPAVIEIDMQD